jgi:hypothetical protein
VRIPQSPYSAVEEEDLPELVDDLSSWDMLADLNEDENDSNIDDIVIVKDITWFALPTSSPRCTFIVEHIVTQNRLNRSSYICTRNKQILL